MLNLKLQLFYIFAWLSTWIFSKSCCNEFFHFFQFHTSTGHQINIIILFSEILICIPRATQWANNFKNVPDPSYRLHLRCFLAPPLLSFCWFPLPCPWHCDEVVNTSRNTHLWIAARTHCYFQSNPAENCCAVTSSPNQLKKKK